ncbi:hypothetical protein H6G93_16640 [Nostoc sp. FACHB-973]|nr:hypothetical protein [Nostoc sp. FACHB-973]
MTVMQRSLFTLSSAIALSFAISAPSSAGTLSGWWYGDWNCNIDGRPARMRWNVVDDSQTTCNGNDCWTSSGVRWNGSFSDNGSRWVALTDPRKGNRGGLYFRHADGNQWYLPQPTDNKTTGWTTWNGQRYPLSCWK